MCRSLLVREDTKWCNSVFLYQLQNYSIQLFCEKGVHNSFELTTNFKPAVTVSWYFPLDADGDDKTTEEAEGLTAPTIQTTAASLSGSTKDLEVPSANLLPDDPDKKEEILEGEKAEDWTTVFALFIHLVMRLVCLCCLCAWLCIFIVCMCMKYINDQMGMQVNLSFVESFCIFK